MQLDADWNEQSAILHASPAHAHPGRGRPACGTGGRFRLRDHHQGDAVPPGRSVTDSKRRLGQLEVAVKNGNFVIGPGRYYVDGIPVENKRAILYTEQPGYPFANSPTP